MNTTQITGVPGRLWYVHVDNAFDSMWPSRQAARAHKAKIAKYGATKVTLSSCSVTVGPISRDLHS
jgi:hypothetical protein